MRNFLIAILLLEIFYHSNAQNTVKDIDSLKHLLAMENKDTSRIKLLIGIANYSTDWDSSFSYAQKALKLAKAVKYPKGEAQALNLTFYIFRASGNYPKALEIGLEALKISESINDSTLIMECYTILATIYAEQNDYAQALDYNLKAKTIAEQNHDELYLSISLLSTGDDYEKLDLLDSAQIFTQLAYEMSDRMNDLDNRGVSLNNLGNIYFKMGEAAIAMSYYKESLPDMEMVKNYDGLCEAWLGMATIFIKTGMSDSALYYARKSLNGAEESGITRRKLLACNFLSDYYESIHRLDSAFAYQKKTIAYKDSLFSEEKVRDVENQAFAEQLRQHEIADAKEQQIITRSKNMQMAGIGAFIPVFFGIILLFSKRKVKPKTIEFMGLLGLLLLFEFIALFLHPYIEEWTHDTPVLMLFILVALASLLVPIHHRMEYWVKEKLASKLKRTLQPVVEDTTNNENIYP